MVGETEAEALSESHSGRQGRPAAASDTPPDAVSADDGDEGFVAVLCFTGYSESMYGPWRDRRSPRTEPTACFEAKGSLRMLERRPAASR